MIKGSIDPNLLKQEPARATSAWMITFADLMSLMLTFFVLLFSVSTVPEEDWTSIKQTMRESLSSGAPVRRDIGSTRFDIGFATPARGMNLSYLDFVINEFISEDKRFSGTNVTLYNDRLEISIPVGSLFRSGESLISIEKKIVLFELGQLLGNIVNDVAVIGYADENQVFGDRFASGWELSMARSAAIANVLKDAGYEDDIRVLGRADLSKVSEKATIRHITIVIYPVGKT